MIHIFLDGHNKILVEEITNINQVTQQYNEIWRNKKNLKSKEKKKKKFPDTEKGSQNGKNGKCGKNGLSGEFIKSCCRGAWFEFQYQLKCNCHGHMRLEPCVVLFRFLWVNSNTTETRDCNYLPLSYSYSIRCGAFWSVWFRLVRSRSTRAISSCTY